MAAVHGLARPKEEYIGLESFDGYMAFVCRQANTSVLESREAGWIVPFAN